MQTLVVGNAMDPETQIGPCIDKKQLDSNLAYIKLGIEEGAKLVCGGKLLKQNRWILLLTCTICWWKIKYENQSRRDVCSYCLCY